MRALIPAALLIATALPALADVVENDVIKVFDGKWVQSKDPSQNGILMYLPQERSSVGEYFSVRCDGAEPSVRVAYSKRHSAKDIGLTVDGVEQRVPAEFTGKTKDPHFLKGNGFGYALKFEDAAARDAFLQGLAQGRMLTVEGRSLPVELAGSAQALREQAGYCK